MSSSVVARPQYASAALYVGDLHPDVTESTLYEFFNSVGPVASIRVCRDATSRKSLGYAYVNYNSVADAERSLDTLNFTPIKGVPCRLMWCHRDPTLRRTGSGNLFVKNLDKALDNKALYDSFSLFGNILSCKVATDDAGRSRGFGFVHFESEDAAKLAIERVNNMKIGAKEVFVGPFIKKRDRVTDRESRITNLYIKNFPENWSEEDLTKLFAEYGTITSVCVAKDKRSRPFGFVNFESSDAAKKAIDELHGRIVKEGKVLSSEDSKLEAKSEAAKPSEAKPASIEAKPAAEGKPETKAEVQAEPKTGADAAESSSNTDEKSSKDEIKTEEDSTIANKTVDLPAAASAEEAKKEQPAEVQVLYVQRAQSKAERYQTLKTLFDSTSNGKVRRYEGVNLYVKNLADHVGDSELKAMFEPFGTITSVRVMRDPNGTSRGFGFVCFATGEEATTAITEMHLKNVDSKPLYVGLAERRDQRIIRLQQRFRNNGESRLPPQGPRQQQQGMPMPMQGGMPTGMPTGMQTGMPISGMQQSGGYPPMAQPSQMASPVWPTRAPGAYGPSSAAVGGMMQQQGPGIQQGMQGGMQGGMPGGYMHRQQQQQQAHHQHMQQMQQMQQQQQARAGGPRPDIMEHASPEIQKQLLGEKLYPLIAKYQPSLAGKITGMMLEMENQELMVLLDSEDELKAKIQEALHVLQQAQQQQVRL